jgi:hypothetical protein
MLSHARNAKFALVVVCGLAGCADATDDTESGQRAAAAAEPDKSAGGAAVNANAADAPARGAAGVAGSPVNAPSDNPGAQPAIAGDQNRPLTGPGKRADDPAYCTERRVSYSKPCHDDPDPCGLDSGWPGDEFCWPAPPEGEGIQIHIGPDDFADPAEVAKYVIEPGTEFNNTVIGHIPLTEDRWYNRVMVRMRPGSHHWLSQVIGGQPEERFYDEGSGCGGLSEQGSLGTIGGGQTLIYDNPPNGEVPPENEGIGSRLPANSSLCMNLHAYNYSDAPQMREMWINVYFMDEDEVTQRTEPIVVIAGLDLMVPPGEKQELTYMEEFAAPGRIIQLWGHRHVWTPRFAVWLNEDLIYDSWDWRESVVFNYDSITENPAPNPDLQTDGAVSGELAVEAGDQLRFSCFIENDSDKTLTWKNELYGGEMCNLWGSTVGEGSGLGRGGGRERAE